MGLFGILWKVAALLILGVIGLGSYLYASDYEATATIVERRDAGEQTLIVIQPDAFPGYRHEALIDADAGRFVCKGYKVAFHVKTQVYQVYDREGDLVYDSERGIQNQGALIQCGATNTGGGILG